MDLGDNELTLTPIPGKSGKAYMGSYPDGKRVFVKMNTSPILPGLAREQIAPQLLWRRSPCTIVAWSSLKPGTVLRKSSITEFKY